MLEDFPSRARLEFAIADESKETGGLFSALEDAVTAGEPYPEELCRRWAEQYDLGPDSARSQGFNDKGLESLRRRLVFAAVAAMAHDNLAYEEGGRRAAEVYKATYRELLKIAEHEGVDLEAYKADKPWNKMYL